jgi:hypothetical protein
VTIFLTTRRVGRRVVYFGSARGIQRIFRL